MCLSCGDVMSGGSPTDDHGDPCNLTLGDLTDAASAQACTITQAAQNICDSLAAITSAAGITLQLTGQGAGLGGASAPIDPVTSPAVSVGAAPGSAVATNQPAGQGGGFLSPEIWNPGPRRSLSAPARRTDHLILAHALGHLSDEDLELALAA